MKKIITTIIAILVMTNGFFAQQRIKNLRIFFFDKKTKRSIIFLNCKLTGDQILSTDKNGMLRLDSVRGTIELDVQGTNEFCQNTYLPKKIKINIDTCKKNSYKYYLDPSQSDFDKVLILFKPKTTECFSINSILNQNYQNFELIQKKEKIVSEFTDVFTLLKCNNNLSILIEGGCSDVEKNELGDSLIINRIMILRDYFINLGISKNRIFSQNNSNRKKKISEDLINAAATDQDKLNTQNTYIYIKVIDK